MSKVLVFVGTYTNLGSEGIYVCQMDSSSGVLELVSITKGVDNPSFLAIDPLQRYLYTVNELKEFEGKPTGTVTSFSIDAKTGELTYLNKKPSHGTDPCYINVDKTARNVIVGNYSSGSVSVLPILEGGQLGEASDVVQHHGSSGVDPLRQQGPHAHCVVLDSTNQYAFVPDLGLDKIMIYKFDCARGMLTPNDEPWVRTEPGDGPRHFTFHPNGKFAYLINQLSSTIVAYDYDARDGRLEEIQRVSTLPSSFSGLSHATDVHVAPSGEFLYASNRGHNSLVTFRVRRENGKLAYFGRVSTRGVWPRNFTLDLTGNFLLAANQNSNTIVNFRVDQQTGRLVATGQVTRVPTPVCLKVVYFP